ncbi:ribose-phosphate pyrophosphokinase [Galbibacter sp. BG1]|uniref:ribose-phosphate diphosphokinase n=1 Tax=Galbibacter sp. BG1 TaxID=1170699 RepID=UPI0015BBCAE8|nr:ribose-phosphate diphosphokinase [Galbibacter sp. BG1]QLE00123.1 ribose-phosphate pyrophosphokinase [Galbibacter sp. BG1]
MILNLDTNFRPFGNQNEISFKAFTFYGGEPHIKIESALDPKKEVTITHRITSFNDLGLLMVAVNALRNMGVKSIRAFLPYFPGARQDRLMVTGEPLTVKVYADVINNLKLEKVTILDPHSEVTPALIDNCEALDNFSFIKHITNSLSGDLLLISPDGGALKKIYKVAAYLKDYPVVECSKTRDVKTGTLSGFKVYAEDLKKQNCLIVDDICDGGGTFIGLAQELKKKNAGNIYLAVTHGIFSKGFDELSAHFEEIYTTDSFKSLSEMKGVTQIKINQLLK